MPSVLKRTISLPAEQAKYIDSLVASGAYATESDVVQAGLQALQDRDSEVDWLDDDMLRREVLPVLEAMDADPSRAIPAEEVEAHLEARYSERSRAASK